VPLELTIVTPQGQVFAGPVDTVVLPGSEGEFGVLPRHERFLTPLKAGEVAIRRGGETVRSRISQGFARVEGESVTVLVESWEAAGAERR
jgi:F-type H+-transporting ATPase subunit epsilon